MATNEEIIRNLNAVAENEPKRFRSLFTENGYWWDVPAGVGHTKATKSLVRPTSTPLHFRTCTANSPTSTSTVTSSSLSRR